MANWTDASGQPHSATRDRRAEFFKDVQDTNGDV